MRAASNGPGANGAAAEVTIAQAIEVLFRHRHYLPPDALRSIQGIWFCASAAQYGEPHEAWDFDEAACREHDTAECEADDDPAECTWHEPPEGTDADR